MGWYALLVLWMFLVALLANHEVLSWEFLEETLKPFSFEVESVFYFWIPTGLIVLVQFAMLLPTARPVRRSGQPRSLWFAGIMAGVLATILTLGVLVVLTDLPRVAVVLGFATGDGVRTARSIGSDRVEALWEYGPIVGGITLVVVWTFWTTVLLLAMKRSPAGWLGRTVRWLLAGSLLELAVALPLYLIVRRKYDCWCSLPSFWAVAGGMVGVLSLAGPGTVLLWRARRGLPTDGWGDRCMICGYQRAKDAGPRCPECGTRWGRVVREETAQKPPSASS